MFFLSAVSAFFPELVNNGFNHLLFQINVERQFTDKGKQLQIFPLLFVYVSECGFGSLKLGLDVFFLPALSVPFPE